MTRRMHLAAVAALWLSGLPGAPALAADSASAEVVNLIHTEIPVLSNGSSYHLVPPTTAIQGYVHIRLDAGAIGKAVWVTSWWIFGDAESLSNGNGTNFWTSYREDGYHKSFGNHGPNSWEDTVLVSVPSVSFKNQVIDECNRLADRLRGQGLSDHAIFSQDRTIDMGLRAGLDYEMSGPSGISPIVEGDSDFTPITLVCKKWGGAALPQVTDQFDSVPPIVEKASLTLMERSGLSGVCKVILSGVIETSTINTAVRFRYKDDAGHQSNVHEVVTDHAGIAMFDHEYNVPNNPDGGESGKIRIVGVSHPFESVKRSYDMDCVAPAATDFLTNLPPAVSLHMIELEKTMVGQQICVSKLRFIVKAVGRSDTKTGHAFFEGDDDYSPPPDDYELERAEVLLFVADRELDWTPDFQSEEAAAPTPADQPRSQSIEIGFRMVNESKAVIAEVPKKVHVFTCVFPALNPAVGGGTDGMTIPPRLPGDAPATPQRLAAGSLTGPQAPAQLALVAPLPDLAIQRTKRGRHPNRLRALVANTGAAATGPTRLSAVYRRNGPNVQRSVAVKPLAPGAKTWVVIDFGLPVKDAKRIGLRVDNPDRIKETNEGNNRAKFKG